MAAAVPEIDPVKDCRAGASGWQPFPGARIIGSVIRALTLAACVCLAVSSAAAELRWPLFAGQMSGELSPLGENGPRLGWEIEARVPEAGRRTFSWRVTGDALQARGSVDVNVGTGSVEWEMEEAVVPVSAWMGVAAERFPEAFSGLEAAGLIHLSGEGALVDGRPQGTVRFRWEGGKVLHPVSDWGLDGIVAEGAFDLEGVGDLAVSIESLRYGAVRMQEGRLGVELGAGRVAGITRLHMQGLGGEIMLAPFTVALARPEASVDIRMTDIAIDQLVALLPRSLSDARGRLDGELAASWSAAEGLRIGAGWFGLAEGDTASVRLAPLPGLITGQLADDSPAFAPLQRVELGDTALNASILRAVFTPAGDVNGRSATVRLQAEPDDPQLKAPLIIDINVAGPLDQLLKLGMDGRIGL